MRATAFRLAVGAVVLATFAGGAATLAQQVTTGGGLQGLNNGFFERNGVAFNFAGPGFQFQQGGFNQALPPFGGFKPGAGAQGGFAFGGGPFSGSLAFEFSQGASLGNVSGSPSVTTMNGFPGFFSDTSQTPFVVGFVPIVGGWGGGMGAGMGTGIVGQQATTYPLSNLKPGDLTRPPISTARPQDSAAGGAGEGRPVPRADTSTAAQAAQSIADIRRLQAAEAAIHAEEAKQYIEQAEKALAAGKPYQAKVYYNMAANRASGELKREIEAKLKDLAGAPAPGRSAAAPKIPAPPAPPAPPALP